MFPRTYVPRVRCSPILCSPVPMFPGTYEPLSYIPPYLCSSVPIFPGTYGPPSYVPRYLCSPAPMFPYVPPYLCSIVSLCSPYLCSPVPMLQRFWCSSHMRAAHQPQKKSLICWVDWFYCITADRISALFNGGNGVMVFNANTYWCLLKAEHKGLMMVIWQTPHQKPNNGLKSFKDYGAKIWNLLSASCKGATVETL